MSNHETHRHIFTILLGVSLTGACAAPSDPEGAAGPDAAPAADAVAVTVGYGASPIATPALRAAHIAARQAEGASDRRYQVIAEGVGLRTERHRGLAARFDAAGVILQTDDGREGRLDAGAIRCGGRALTAPRGSLTVDPAAANRIVRGASAGAREWYVNGPLGLEHGFDLDPAGCAATLTVDLATPGFVPAQVGDDVRLVAADGSVALRYGDLFAHDAFGQELPARFLVGPQRVTIAVDVVGARGVVTIDPLVYVEIERVGPAGDASDTAAGDGFGSSVAMAGATAVVGAPGDDVDGRVDQGAAYVYVRDGHRWSLQARLIAADGAAGDGFGTDVAVDGDTVVVAAPGDDNGAVVNQGAAYVFVRSGAAWGLQARLVAFDGAADDGFGYRVALAGNTALVSARGDDVGTRIDQGGVYFYARNGVAWSLQIKVNVPDGQAGDELGSSVALSPDTAVIGAAGDDGAAVDQGSAYVYIRSGGGWAQQAKLLAGDPAAQDRFGVSVALSGNTALVGSYLDNGAFPDQGSAYVFVRNVASWQQRQKLVAADGAGDDHFGVRVAVLGDLALIGSSVDDVGANVDQGSAYVFVRAGVGAPFVPDARLVSSDGATGDQFGYSVVAIAEAGAIYYTAVGAPFADGAPPVGGVDEGAVYFGHLDRPGVCSGQPAGTVCRAAAAPCDAVEVCDGVDSTCPADALEPAGTACGDGSDSACDHPDSCNAAGGCEANYEAATTICRADSGACDVAETCDGAGACPADSFEPAGTACGDGSDSACDHPDSCNAAGGCEANYEAATTICRADSGACDVAETCDGAGACPADSFEPAGTACGDGSDSACDHPDSCNAAGGCEANYEAATTICRADSGACDVAETCDGAGACPADAYEPAGTACGDGSDSACDHPDSCNAAGGCEANYEAATTICRADSGACDVAETCDGAGACPADAYEPAGTACGDGSDSACDHPDSCNAAGGCEANYEAATTICRADSGACDVAETCDGAGACPADAYEPAGTACGDGSDSACDHPDSCNAAGGCEANYEAATTICRADSGACDVAETCDGAGACPADSFEPAGTACGDGSDSACDHPDSCNAAGGCEANYEAATTICRADSGACDVAETCDGAGACPADSFEPAGTACDPVGETCAASAETCTGGSASCPADDPTPCAPPPVPPIRWVSIPSPTIVGKCVHASRLHLFERPIAVNRFGFPLPVTCAPISGVGVHDDVVCTARDFAGHTATTTITVTVLARLRVAFQAPLLDDNQRDNVHTDHDIVNLFKVGATVAHRVKLYACDGRDVTQALMPSVSVKLHVTERNQYSDHLVVDVPESYVGTGGPGGLMVPSGGVFEYDLRTNGFEANTSNNGRYFRSLVKVAYNTNPTITVGREDARLESKR